MMTAADYWVVAIVVLCAIIGLVRGFLREAIALVSLLLALFIAWHFSAQLAPHLGGLLSNENIRPWAARAIVFVGVLFIGAVAGAIIGHFLRLSLFIVTDRFLGFTLGAVRAGVVLAVLVIVCQLLRLDDEGWWRTSRLLPYVERMADALRTFVGEEHHHTTRV